MLYDPHELYRLQDENAYLREQVRTLSAELNAHDRAKFLIVGADGRSMLRPTARTAAAQILVTDETIELARFPFDVLGQTARRLKGSIDRLAAEDGMKPLDRIWRFSVERDYAA